ncbi:MAG: trigger factor [Planctomycetes bacterium]|nr:trigger factor [Planctomycetota bacterium]
MAEKEKDAKETVEEAQNAGQTGEKQDEDKKPEIEDIVTIEDSGPCKKKVSIEIVEEKIKAAMGEQFDELRRDAIIPGFRKGRAPQRLIEKRFGSDVSEQVKLKLMAGASETALKDIDSLGDPDVDHEKVELPETGSMKFEFEVEVRPEFDLPELEGIAVEKPKIETTDEQIEAEIEAMCKRNGIWTPKESEVVEAEDQVVADAVLKIEDTAEDEKHDNIEIFARASGFIGGVPVEKLDELLGGAKPGDTKTTSVDVPATFFNERYRGKKVEIEITVKEVKQLEPAALDEDFFKRYGIEDEDELRDNIRDGRAAQAEQQARAGMGEQIHKYLLDNTKLDLPEDIVADQSRHILQRQYTNLLVQGLPREQIDAQMQSLQASSATQAQEQMKRFFIMDKVGEKLDITVTEEEINGHIAQIAASRGRRPEKMREELARDGSLAQLSLQIREQNCIEKILETAKITEAKAAKAKDKPAKKKAAVKKADKKAPAKKDTEKAEKKTAKKKTAKKSTSSREETSAKRTKKADTPKSGKKDNKKGK